MSLLRRYIRKLLKEEFQSHTFEPNIGDSIINTNINCKHKGSRGVVLTVRKLPEDAGKVASYRCSNDGPNWSKGDILEKTLDQLSPLGKMIESKFSAEDFKDVYNTARMAHVGQTRRDGSEYFSHPSEVRNITRNFYPGDKVAQLAALLHDSLEDAPGSTVESPKEMEDFIRGSIQNNSQADEVIRVVRALTHEKGGDYLSYVVGLINDVPTLRVKLSDMVHNLSDNPSPKQRTKYKSALEAISNQTQGRPPRGISGEHWDQLLSLTEHSSLLKKYVATLLKEAEGEGVSCPIRGAWYGGMPAGGGFAAYKEYTVAAQRYGEAAHCILGSLGRRVGAQGNTEWHSMVRGEKEHLLEEIGIMKQTIEEYSRDLYIDQINDLTIYKEDRREEIAEYNQGAIDNIRKMAPKLEEKARNNIGRLDAIKNAEPEFPDSVFKVALYTYQCLGMLGMFMLKSIEDWDDERGTGLDPTKNAFKNQKLRSRTFLLDQAIDEMINDLGPA